MLDELSKIKTSLSVELKMELITRIKERRTQYSDVLQYLHNPSQYLTFSTNAIDDCSDLFNQSSKSSISKLILSLIERLFINDSNTSGNNSADDDDDDNESDDDVVVTQNLSMKDRLNLVIKEKI